MAITKSNPITLKVSLMSLFSLYKTSQPRPALQDRPATTEPKLITPFKNKSARATEAAQVGISPIKAATTG